MWQKNNSLIAKIMLFMSGLLVLSGIILLTLLRYTGDVLAGEPTERNRSFAEYL